jgi:SAM-dependent methyltransferase
VVETKRPGLLAQFIDWAQETPWVYRFTQKYLAPGSSAAISDLLGRITSTVDSSGRCLDIGCGPSSLLWGFGFDPIGVDVSSAYARKFVRHGRRAALGTASDLPFLDGTIDGVWSVGLVHHLDVDGARAAVFEMLRVTRPDGYVVIIDAVMPRSPWRRPLAYLLRRWDRGGNVRRQEALMSIIEGTGNWTLERITISHFGQEAVILHLKKGG